MKTEQMQKALNPLIVPSGNDLDSVNTGTVRNVRDVLGIVEQITGYASETDANLSGKEMRGLSLILECAEQALNFELVKIEGSGNE